MNFDQTEHQHIASANSGDDALQAYNAAFRALGLGWQWDADTYRNLLRIPEEMERIGTYLVTQQANLLTAYGKEFLSSLIYATKQHCEEGTTETAALPSRFDDVQ